jgi:hypothetical protein
MGLCRALNMELVRDHDVIEEEAPGTFARPRHSLWFWKMVGAKGALSLKICNLRGHAVAGAGRS